MKRFHVHVAVTDLPASVAFYSKLFGQSPAKLQPDYAKWMLDEPRVNFAISSRGRPAGVNHLGMQAESKEELTQLKALADAASEGAALDQGESTCCYAKSDKHWAIDPLGLAWEHFLVLSDVADFGADMTTETRACCIPLRPHKTTRCVPAKSPCCVPTEEKASAACCE